jgi:hypothetical protein
MLLAVEKELPAIQECVMGMGQLWVVILRERKMKIIIN